MCCWTAVSSSTSLLYSLSRRPARPTRPVAKICQIGWFCQLRDIHLQASGYAEMAQLIADALPKKKKGK